MCSLNCSLNIQSTPFGNSGPGLARVGIKRFEVFTPRRFAGLPINEEVVGFHEIKPFVMRTTQTVSS
jgi:hypothetical protein